MIVTLAGGGGGAAFCWAICIGFPPHP